ncbi:hypothetical protein RHSP_25713 [Rhizobium freirei PRF 81]|uniref:Uncharacterized protein n=1 Tax=Rhizobium freirei PRF 81 TaxID=363754 RepID=N6V8E1_9HYPH|nr:hypothetical protein RHSP_25713 [Rhizobium freirei PRF 81]
MCIQKGLGRFIILALRIERFAEPEIRIRGPRAAWVAVDILAELSFGDTIIAGQDVAVSGLVLIVFVAERGRLRPRACARRRAGTVIGPGIRTADLAAVLIELDRAELGRRLAGAGTPRGSRIAVLRVAYDVGNVILLAAGALSRHIGLALLHRAAGRRTAATLLDLLEAELVVFLRLADLFLHLQQLIAHFLDAAVQLAQLVLEPLQANLGIAALNFDDRSAAILGLSLIRAVGRRLRGGVAASQVDSKQRHGRGIALTTCKSSETKHARHNKFFHMDRPVSLILRARGSNRRFLQLLSKSNGVRPKCGQKNKGDPEAAFIIWTGRLTDQEPAPFSTVTARRFCDQQEISSQVATGRSLP